LILYFYPQLVGNIFRSPELTLLAPKIGVVIWLWIFSTFLEIVAIANQEARLATVFIISTQFSKTFLMVGAVLIFTTVDALIYAAIIQGILQTLVLLFYLSRKFPGFWTSFDLKFFREQMIYAVPFGVSGILWILQNDIHNYFVGYGFSTAEFAIYAYGCFQLPLVSMLFEAVTGVLIPRMSELQMRGDRGEMIRLTARAMQKLAFFYFPIYVFLMITAETFILTLFTRNYLASVPIFMINLTLLPLQILVTDPIVRSYQELGRFLLVVRIFILIAMVTTLYFGIGYFNLSGMIAIVVVIAIIEKIISETMIVRKLGVRRKDLGLLKDIWKTAAISIISGTLTYFAYVYGKDSMFVFGEFIASVMLGSTKPTVINFIGGSLTLTFSFLIFAPVYLFLSNYFNVIDEGEKKSVKTFIGKLRRFFKRNPLPEPQSEISN
jgi:O-antigen/teichoic acid export membrane protein